jgi:DNA-binding MarR family transcriptional regulator
VHHDPSPDRHRGAADGQVESLGDAFGTVARRQRSESMASLSSWDVTPSQMRALRVLTRHGHARSSELAQHLHIAPRSATEVIDALEAKGLVRRSPDPSDRRATLVSLTDHGERLGEEVRRARGALSERFFDRLDDEDRDHLARILRTLLAD